MKQILRLLVLVLLISPFARAVADDSSDAKKKAITQEIARIKQLKIETANGFEKSRKELDASIAKYMKRRDEFVPNLSDHTKLTADGKTTPASMALAEIGRIDESLKNLRQARAQTLTDSQSAMKSFDEAIRLQQQASSELDRQAMEKATYNLTHWRETNRIASPGSSPASDSALAASPLSAKAADSSSPQGYKDSVRDDAETKTLRVNNTSPTPTAKPNGVATTPPPVLVGTTLPAAPQLKGEDKLLYATLNDIIEDMNKPTDDAAKRTKLLNEFLTQSKPFVASHPDYTNLWVMRTMAAMETDNVEAGWKAGQQLKRLNVLDGDDTKALKAMSGLKRKGWLVDDYATIAKTQAEEQGKKISEIKEWLTGRWIEESDSGVDRTTRTIIVGLNSETSTMSAKFSYFLGGDSGPYETQDVKLSEDGRILKLHFNRGVTENPLSFIFLIDRDGLKLVMLREGEDQLPIEKLNIPASRIIFKK